MHGSVWYNLVFAAATCVICAVFVSGSAVALRDRQVANELLEKQRNVLLAAGLASEDESLSREEVGRRSEQIRQVVINIESGDEAPELDPAVFDQRAATADDETGSPAPPNEAGVQRLPHHALVYELRDETGALNLVVLPVNGLGLWSTLYGFIALDADLETVRGLTFYEHKETPGLGGEVDNLRWKSLWPGRRVFDGDEVRIEVIKGRAGPAKDDPHRVDGLAGATITSRGVSRLVRFWLGQHGFGPYLGRLRGGGIS